ncbi:hypothetical protein FBZ83_109230 [Azospirillum brasilense]|uniref:Uncharacterized protein n=1 Tax=Azospirillum brasilense TaxID=192 RepID=A0A560C6E7_AZOBR|nr:hypothetical protein [Azospirillum brasilense]TWA80421.1 hypothetical protein FBZ83_109230 [Azospirillum brasilense]
MSASNAYAIEVQGRSAGIVVAGQGGFTFFVSDWSFKDLDRQTFRNVGQAERAAKQLAARRSGVRRR